MRSTKELLQLTLEQGNGLSKFNFRKLRRDFYLTGLCALINWMNQASIINNLEYNELRMFIAHNQPKFGSKHYHRCSELSGYYWPRNHWTPRKKWLKDQINSL